MNELDETKLNSWQPRRPSARLKHRIFAANQTSRAAFKWFWSAFAPTLAAASAALIMLNSSYDAIRPKSAQTLIFSNQTDALCVANNSQSSENRLAAVTFDWTNHSFFPSIMRFTPTTNLSN